MDIFNIEKLTRFLKNTPKYIWVLFLIIAVGIFLRTYNFHDWLTFENDQVRDATLMGNVLEGEKVMPPLGPSMRKSENQEGELFHLGTIYYNFQLIAGKIFGNSPEKFAYPDLLFSILVIPLFFLFLKKYFTETISLLMTGIFSISFFAIQYSRFAWNPNSIPFFVILLLFSAFEIISKKEKTHWFWFVLLGIAFGIGIQLHAVLLALFPMFSVYIIWNLRKNFGSIWAKITICLALILLLNTSQIVHELKTGFKNTRIFINSSLVDKSQQQSSFAKNIAEDIGCHIEGNAYIISGTGEDECQFYLAKLIQSEKSKKFIKEMRTFRFWAEGTVSLAFSLFGFACLVIAYRKSIDVRKKLFLQMIIVYITLSFLVMFPVIGDNISKFRYFNHVFFVPYIFLGLFLMFLLKRRRTSFLLISAVIIIIFAFSNLYSLMTSWRELITSQRSDLHYAVLGEMENIVRHIKDNSSYNKKAYLAGDDLYAAHFIQPLSYIAKRQGFEIARAKQGAELLTDQPVFYVAEKIKSKDGKLSDREIEKCDNIGKIIICKLK